MCWFQIKQNTQLAGQDRSYPSPQGAGESRYETLFYFIFKRYHEKQDRVQLKAIQMVQGLGHRILDICGCWLGQGKLRGNLVAAYDYLKGTCKGDRVKFSLVRKGGRTRLWRLHRWLRGHLYWPNPQAHFNWKIGLETSWNLFQPPFWHFDGFMTYTLSYNSKWVQENSEMRILSIHGTVIVGCSFIIKVVDFGMVKHDLLWHIDVARCSFQNIFLHIFIPFKYTYIYVKCSQEILK